MDAEVAELERLFAKEPVRFLRPETWHITLTFLGEEDDEAVGEIVHAMQEAAEERESFTVRFTDALYGPPGRSPRMIWLGADEESASQLTALKAGLDGRLRARDVRIAEVERRFEGHLTVARFVGPVRTHPALPLKRPIEFEALSLDLMESLPDGHGVQYDCLGSVLLKGAMDFEGSGR